ncbi:hypothetical protein BV22DRAFT_1133161 [Leucogyrophana mollusca]|uniref:Uncharacterized protein n=1 Tax=Leucogyrophana mollusca TaxID=85980 RepID=A0ACB8B583_9AGAM|nr:hypothetical protein BV22DRAFT_1133161 [Leucogyrophana mollusca]
MRALSSPPSIADLTSEIPNTGTGGGNHPRATRLLTSDTNTAQPGSADVRDLVTLGPNSDKGKTSWRRDVQELLDTSYADCERASEDEEDNFDDDDDEFLPIEDGEEVSSPSEGSRPDGPHTALENESAPAEPQKGVKPRSSMPKWLKDDYATTCTRLRDEITKRGRPSCYEAGQFLLTPPSPIFS